MEVSSQDPSLMAMDLSKGFPVAPLTRGHAEAMDLAKKPEWYHRRPPSCSTDISAPFRSRASSSYNSLSAPVHCRDAEPRPESLGDYMNSTLPRGLDLYRDGVHGNLWHPGFYRQDQTGGPVPESSGGEESDSGSDVIFLVSSAKEPLLCGPFIQDGVRHIVEPLSPAVSSLDEGRGCYHLPQPLSSPSPDSSYSEDSSDSSVDIPVHHTRPVVLLSDLSAVYRNPAESPVDISSDDSDVVEVSVTEEKKSKRFPCKRSPRGSPPHSSDGKTPPRRSSRVRKSVSDSPPFACSASRHSLRRRVKNDAVGIYNESCDSDDMIEYAVRMSSSDADEPASRPYASRRASSNSEDVDTDRKSPRREQQPPPRRTRSAKPQAPVAVCRSEKLRTEQKLNRGVRPEQKTATTKAAVRRRKRRRTQTGPPVPFPAREPEIQLKYATVKKEKKSGAFCPFVHMERRSCTVVNYQEEEASARSSRGAPAPTSLPGFVPNTSCFQLGRFSPDSRGQAALLCGLCGQTANAVGLGDLHGPYRPAGPPLDRRTPSAEEEPSPGPAQSHPVNSDQSDKRAPPRLHECWIHEDCGIWSAGVFLVRGKLYGLEEAARLAQQTVCSACQQTGAIMGCFQKGCARNYHYRCAIQSGCVLNEDNFSIRCPEHKNKLLKRHKR